jgi:hypothetical protein
MAPALVLLLIAVVGIYLFITERNQSPLAATPKKTVSRKATKPTVAVKKSTSKTRTSAKSAAPRKRK